MTVGAPRFFSRQITAARRFHLNLAPPRSIRLAVVSGGCEQCAPDYRIARNRFPFHCIEFVAGGAGRLLLGGRPVQMAPPMVFTYGPGTPHEIESDPDRPLLKYFVDFTGRAAGRLLRRAGLAPGTVTRASDPAGVLSLFEMLIRFGQRAGPGALRRCGLALETLAEVLSDSEPPAAAPDTARATYERCRRHVERDWRRLTGTAQIARECHVDQAYLCRLFRRYGGLTPLQCLTRLRMTHAAGCLRLPGVMVKNVAAELGFSDPFHFSRTFKRVFGISPSEFAGLYSTQNPERGGG